MQMLRHLAIKTVTLMLLASTPALVCSAMEEPDTVELDSLAHYYDAVTFNHATHVDMLDANCAACHHHTTGSGILDSQCASCHENDTEGDMIACRDCHAVARFDSPYLQAMENDPTLFHTDKPGLKGAYHTSCMGCHQVNDGPVGCQDCHTRNTKGDRFFHAGEFAPTVDHSSAAKH